MHSAIYAGSFDPVTIGHLDIIKKASKLFDKVYIAIAVNPVKECMFSSDDRQEMLEVAMKDILNKDQCNIIVMYEDDIVIDLAHNLDCHYLIHGIRDQSDILHERMIYDINKALSSDIDTVFIMCDSDLVNISSSAVRNVIKYSSNLETNKYVRALYRYLPSKVIDLLTKNC